jgi:hypothetical protein
VVQITVPQGLVVRDSGADGRTYFNVMNGGNLYQEMVVVGSVTRVTEDPAALLSRNVRAELIAAGLPTTSSLVPAAIPTAFAQSSYSQGGNLMVMSYLASGSTAQNVEGNIALTTVGDTFDGGFGLLSDQSYGIADNLQQSYVLGSPGEQPLISGLTTFSQDTFEYWVDTLSL